MAWKSVGAAVTVTDSAGTPSAAVLSSTGTIPVLEDRALRLRMFLHDLTVPGAVVDFTVSCNTSSDDCDGAFWTNATESSPHIQYINSSLVWHTRVGVFGGAFSADAREADQVFETCIPSEKDEQPWDYDYLDLDTTTGTISTATTSGVLNVQYKDPQILKLPEDHGWLMILSRTRCFYPAKDNQHTNSVGDIVAWWCSTADFGCTAVGPFLLVDSLHAWPDATVRIWLGTAGAALIGDQLLVYYSVERNYDGANHPLLDPTLSKTTYEASLDDVGFSPGVAVSVISWTTLYEAITEEQAAPGVWTTESMWNLGYSLTSGAIESTPLGLIQVWIAQDSGAVRAFEDIYDGDGDAASIPKWADPAAAVCDGSLSLYLSGGVPGAGAVIYPFGPGPGGLHLRGSGHGLWRCRAIVDGFPLLTGPGIHVTTFGVDFVVAPLSLGAHRGVSPDQIVQAHSNMIYLDPDPVQMPDGSWRVYAGRTSPPTDRSLWIFRGQAEEGCSTADDVGLLEAGEIFSDSIALSDTGGGPTLGSLALRGLLKVSGGAHSITEDLTVSHSPFDMERM